MADLRRRLLESSDRPLVMDGGGATTLAGMGVTLDPVLWSAGALLDAPEAVTACHAAFTRAGAELLTTLTYQASFEGFGRRGIDQESARAAMASAVGLARAASRDALVAASIGSYGGVLADGSEYRGGYGLSVEALMEFHRPRIEACRVGADVIACETVPELAEVRAFARLAEAWTTPTFIAVTVRDGEHLRSGEPLREAFDIVADSAAAAFALNCSAPSHVTRALEHLPAGEMPILAYANSGESWVDGAWSGDRGPRPFADHVAEWLDRGAAGVGGCCRVTPDDIREVAALVARR